MLLLALSFGGRAFGQAASPLVLYPIADPVMYLGSGGVELASHSVSPMP